MNVRTFFGGKKWLFNRSQSTFPRFWPLTKLFKVKLSENSLLKPLMRLFRYLNLTFVDKILIFFDENDKILTETILTLLICQFFVSFRDFASKFQSKLFRPFSTCKELLEETRFLVKYKSLCNTFFCICMSRN